MRFPIRPFLLWLECDSRWFKYYTLPILASLTPEHNSRSRRQDKKGKNCTAQQLQAGERETRDSQSHSTLQEFPSIPFHSTPPHSLPCHSQTPNSSPSLSSKSAACSFSLMAVDFRGRWAGRVMVELTVGALRVAGPGFWPRIRNRGETQPVEN